MIAQFGPKPFRIIWQRVVARSYVQSWLLRDTYTTKNGTFNPTVTTNDGSVVTWVIGGVNYDTNSPSVAVSGTTTIKLYCPNPAAVTAINIYSQSLVGSLALADLSGYTSLTTLSAQSNSALTVTGTLGDLPASMAYLHLYSTSSTITGTLADLPASMTYLHLDSTSSTITGGGTAMAAVNNQQLQIYSMTMSQSNVDDCVSRLYSDRASFLYASPVLGIGGTNAAPSGTYQDGDPPSTGKEYIYELVNDPEAESFKKWAIMYTA